MLRISEQLILWCGGRENIYEECFLLLGRYLISFVFMLLRGGSRPCRCTPSILLPRLCIVLQYLVVQREALKTHVYKV